MKKAIEYIAQRPKMLLLGLLLLCNALRVYGQFQTTIGFPYPIEEKSPGGIITPSGDYLILGGNNNNPNGLFGVLDGDLQLTWLNSAGNISQPSQMLGTFPFDNAAWIENAVCAGTDHYLIASSSRKVMVLTLTDPAGTPVWSRYIGSIVSSYVLTSACVKMDANGFIILVGTQYDPSSGVNSMVAVKIDCNGNQLWSRVYQLNGYSSTVTSVTTFATFPGGSGNYYITGKVSPIAGGNEEVFLLQLNDLTGGFGFMKRYSVAPNADDVGTCIQGSSAPAPNGGIWISGYSEEISVGKNVMMMRLDLNGNVQWAKNYDHLVGDEFANHFQFAANGKLVITGRAEEYTAFQGTKAGDCMLMRIDIFGNTVDWVRAYTNNGFSSLGNRVEVTANGEFFVTGESLELLSPSQSANNVLAIKTDPQGLTSGNCYHGFTTQIIPRTPIVSGVSPAALTIYPPPDFGPDMLGTLTYNDQQAFCSAPQPCDCDFTWTDTGCFAGFFTATCIPATTGNYTYVWDLDCDPNTPNVTTIASNTDPNAISFSATYPYTFPCGGGTFTVCVKVTAPNGLICNITHTITVPNTCCGTAAGMLACHPTDPYKYNFTINYNDPPGSTACSHVLTSPYTLTNVLYGTNTITGCVAVTDPIPLGLNFTLQTNCTCITTGLPMTCTLPFTVATVCCKEICVDDQIVCEGLDEFMVPFYACNWPPVNNVYHVTWYVMPKPATGCPSTYWGGQPYQSTFVNNILEPLLLFPNSLPSDVCVYAVIDLDDGPCTQITSNIATVQLCKPNACTLNSKDYCYLGACVLPDPIMLTSTVTPPTCFSTVDWFEGNNPVAVQNGGSSFQPPCLSMANDQNCYEDFIYTAVITDGCGQHSCQSRIRLYSGQAPIGTLAMIPSKTPPLCRGEDVTLKFTPTCASEPPKWAWYERDCIGNLSIMQNAGLTNNCLNLNELYNGAWYGVGAVNGVCPIRSVEMEIPILEPAVINNFDAVADPCAEVQVVLSASVNPGVISCSNAAFPCTYTYEWYKDGFLIGTTPGGTASESFTYVNPNPPNTMAGNYYCFIREDCCPRNIIQSWVVTIGVSCEPVVMGPCFICDNQSVTLMAQMVLPPNLPCPTASSCTFTWYDAINVGGIWVMNNVIGTGATLTVTVGGHYFLESNCNGCIKKVEFKLLGCLSGNLAGQTGCGPVSVEELMSEEESPLRIFPNPTTGEITIEWTGNAPKNARIFITDPMGRRLRMLTVPDATNSLTTTIDDLPSGLYFVKVQSADRLFTVAKLTKE